MTGVVSAITDIEGEVFTEEGRGEPDFPGLIGAEAADVGCIVRANAVDAGTGAEVASSSLGRSGPERTGAFKQEKITLWK